MDRVALDEEGERNPSEAAETEEAGATDNEESSEDDDEEQHDRGVPESDRADIADEKGIDEEDEEVDKDAATVDQDSLVKRSRTYVTGQRPDNNTKLKELEVALTEEDKSPVPPGADLPPDSPRFVHPAPTANKLSMVGMEVMENTAVGRFHLPGMALDSFTPVFVLAHHHHIVQFTDMHLDTPPTRPASNLLSNSNTDSSHHHHTSEHHHTHSICDVLVPGNQDHEVLLPIEPHVRMRSKTVGTISSYALYCEQQCYVELSHHFIHMHEIFCPSICFKQHTEGEKCNFLHNHMRRSIHNNIVRPMPVVTTKTRTSTTCKRLGTGSFGHFHHRHTHTHSLHLACAMEPCNLPPGSPHDWYADSMAVKEPVEEERPRSPFSTK